MGIERRLSAEFDSVKSLAEWWDAEVEVSVLNKNFC